MRIAQRSAHYLRTLRELKHLYELGQFSKIGALLDELDPVDMEIVQWALDAVGAEPQANSSSPKGRPPALAEMQPQSSPPSAPVIPLYSRKVLCS